LVVGSPLGSNNFNQGVIIMKNIILFLAVVLLVLCTCITSQEEQKVIKEGKVLMTFNFQITRGDYFFFGIDNVKIIKESNSVNHQIDPVEWFQFSNKSELQTINYQIKIVKQKLKDKSNEWKLINKAEEGDIQITCEYILDVPSDEGTLSISDVNFSINESGLNVIKIPLHFKNNLNKTCVIVVGDNAKTIKDKFAKSLSNRNKKFTWEKWPLKGE
jgi:hypothetical protein